MTRFSGQPRFGVPPAAGPKRPHVGRAASRRFAMLRAADEVLGVIPAEGESVHTLMTGYYDLMNVLVRLVERLGPLTALRVATLAMNGRNLEELARLMDAAPGCTLTLLVSCFFRDHNKDLWKRVRRELASRGGRAAAARSHCKVVCLEAGGVRLVLEGSANLRTNRNREQLTLARDPALFDWHSRWIDDVVREHGGEPEEADEAARERGAD